MKRIAILLIIPFAFACKSPKSVTEGAAEAATEASEDINTTDGSIVITTDAEEATEDVSNGTTEKPYSIKATIGDINTKSDYLTITSAFIEGNTLRLQVAYSGGCERHSFKFVGSGAISKSLPPQRAVKLIHDNGGDMCEAMVQHEIEIDISELAYKQSPGSEIILNLEGLEEPLNYVYP